MPSAITTTARPSALEHVARFTPAVAAFFAGAGPVILLGFSRGGYPVEVVAGYGVALTWLLIVGFVTGAIPRPRPTGAGWAVLAALGGLVAWGLLSLGWSADQERGLTEVVRLLVATGSLLLGMSAVRAGHSRLLLGGVFAGLSAIVAASALSRLQPDLFAGAAVTSEFLGSDARTSWPLNYWNAIAAAGSMAVALAIVLASRAASPLTAAACAAPVPVVILGMAFTLSRGGILAAVVAGATGVLLVSSRPVLIRTLVAPAVGAVALVVAAYRSEALADATGGVAQSADGRTIIVLAVLVTVGVGLVQAGWFFADAARWTRRLPRASPRATTAILGAVIVGGLVIAAVAGAPDRLDRAWSDFQTPTVRAAGTDRLASLSSSHRYQIWAGALDAMESHPVRGIGLGSWESWWSARRGNTGFVRNAHSEPFELLAEVGIVGGSLFLIVLIVPLAAGARGALRRGRTPPDAVLAAPALAAFGVALAIDWNWQIGAVMVAGMTIAAVPLCRPRLADPPVTERPVPTRRRRLVRNGALSLAVASLGVGTISVLAVALVAPQGVQASREAAARGDLDTASALAAEASGAAGFAASPALQLALVEEQAGRLGEASVAAALATDRAPNDWRGWFLTARIAVARGKTKTAVAAFRRARDLNPDSPILKP